jgi:endogenous inhibitor of DNA gyrase (YacG/DUF329 family)
VPARAAAAGVARRVEVGWFRRLLFLGSTDVRIVDACAKGEAVVSAMYFECSECDEQFALPEIQVYAHARPLCSLRCGCVDLDWLGDGWSALLAAADIQAA